MQLDVLNVQHGLGYTVNGNGAKSQRLELAMETRPLTDLALAAWLSYDDAALTKAVPTGGAYGVSGNRVPNTSRYSGNLSVAQEFAVAVSRT